MTQLRSIPAVLIRLAPPQLLGGVSINQIERLNPSVRVADCRSPPLNGTHKQGELGSLPHNRRQGFRRNHRALKGTEDLKTARPARGDTRKRGASDPRCGEARPNGKQGSTKFA